MESRFTHVSVLGAISFLFNLQHKTALTTVGMKTHPKNTVGTYFKLLVSFKLIGGISGWEARPYSPFTWTKNSKVAT